MIVIPDLIRDPCNPRMPCSLLSIVLITDRTRVKNIFLLTPFAPESYSYNIGKTPKFFLRTGKGFGAVELDNRLLYVYIFSVLSTGIAAAVVPLIIARVISPRRRPGAISVQPYECGMQTRGFAWDFRFGIAFYLYALIFLAFEVDVLYLFPAAAAFAPETGMRALMLLGLFLTVLSLSLVYAWKKGSFEWTPPDIDKKDVPRQDAR